MRDSPVQPGEILAGKYRVVRVLGYGAMGVVVAADHLGIGHQVALKFMLRRGGTKAAREARFLREAKIAALLKSRHVCRVFDAGVLEDGAAYIEMDLLEGQDLSRLLRKEGPLPVGVAVDYVLQACEAVAEAHAAGVVHRDLKPANLFLARESSGGASIKVLDFGISKLEEPDVELTQSGDAIGSPLYMAPEQMRSARDVDGRSDVWSLGVILYELIAGKTPFHAETMIMLVQRLLHDAPTPLSHHRADVPPGLAAAVLRAVEKDRAQRWPDVASFAAAIAPFAASCAAAAPPALAAPISTAPRSPLASTGIAALAASTTPRTPPPPAFRRSALLVGSALGAVAVVAALAAFARLGSAPPAAPRPATSIAPAPPPVSAPPASASASTSASASASTSASASASTSASASASPAPAASAAPSVSARPRAAPRASAKAPAEVDYDQR